MLPRCTVPDVDREAFARWLRACSSGS
jgi:hypothetical protein